MIIYSNTVTPRRAAACTAELLLCALWPWCHELGSVLGAESAGTLPTTNCCNFVSASTVCAWVCVSMCVTFPVRAKQNKHSWLSCPPPPSLCWLQMRVFQMNNTRREMTNSRRDERLNMWEPESKMGFISSMWRCALEPIKRGRRDSLLFLLLLLLLFCSWCSEAALRRTGLAV